MKFYPIYIFLVCTTVHPTVPLCLIIEHYSRHGVLGVVEETDTASPSTGVSISHLIVVIALY